MQSRNFAIGLLSFLTLIDLFGSQALLPRLTIAFNTDPAAMGFAVNSTTLGMAAAGLAVAVFGRHINAVRGIWVSLALLAIPTALLGFTTDLTVFTWLRIAQGVLMSAAFTLTMSYLAEECSLSEAAGAMAAYITGNVLSNLVGRLLAANFADWFGLNVSFWIFAAMNLCGAVMAAWCLKQTPKPPTNEDPMPVLKVWKIHLTNPHLRTSFMLGFIILFVFLSVFTYVNFILSQSPFDLTPAELGYVYLVFLPAVFTTPLAGKMVASRGVYYAFMMSMGLALGGMFALLIPDIAAILVGLMMIGVGTFCAQAVVSGRIGAAATADRAAASGLYLTCYYLGGLSGAFVIGRIFTATGWSASIVTLIIITALSLLIALPLNRPLPSRAS